MGFNLAYKGLRRVICTNSIYGGAVKSVENTCNEMEGKRLYGDNCMCRIVRIICSNSSLKGW
jgi:uncharacterized hydantoinase/oxoprolinase family protein